MLLWLLFDRALHVSPEDQTETTAAVFRHGRKAAAAVLHLQTSFTAIRSSGARRTMSETAETAANGAVPVPEGTARGERERMEGVRGIE